MPCNDGAFPVYSVALLKIHWIFMLCLFALDAFGIFVVTKI